MKPPFSGNRRHFLKLLTGFVTVLPFTSQASEKPKKLRFAVASDGHYGQPNTPYQADFDNLMAALNQEKKDKGLDFCVFNGDLFHDKPEFLPKVKQSFDTLVTKYYVTRGNHDMVSREVWQQTWGYNTNHALQIKEYGIVLLDNSNEQGTYVCPEMDFLQKTLNDFSKLKTVFVFMHISPRKWTKNGIDCQDINTLIDKTPNVKALFHGHDHDVDGKKVSEGGKNHFWDARFAGNWGTDYKGYRIVEVDTDGSVYTYQYNMSEKKKVNEDRF